MRPSSNINFSFSIPQNSAAFPRDKRYNPKSLTASKKLNSASSSSGAFPEVTNKSSA